MTRGWVHLAVLTGALAASVLIATPAAADVNCADLKTQGTAQSYFDGRTGDADGLDADSDGKACEHNSPGSPGTWTLIGLTALMAAGLIRFSTDAGRQARRSPAPAPAGRPQEPVAAPQLSLVVNVKDDGMPEPVQKKSLVAQASAGSIGELARALRLVPYAQRMSVLEEHARVHGTPPQDVLDALAESTTDLELQGWALAGYDPPWFVRPMHCDCVGGLRNYRLRTAEDGSHFWACASCQSRDRHPS